MVARKERQVDLKVGNRAVEHEQMVVGPLRLLTSRSVVSVPRFELQVERDSLPATTVEELWHARESIHADEDSCPLQRPFLSSETASTLVVIQTNRHPKVPSFSALHVPRSRSHGSES